MSILVNADSRILVQGLTGREGQFHARQMLDYGTNIVAGCTPGKGGMEVLGVPVFNTCAEAVKATGAMSASSSCLRRRPPTPPVPLRRRASSWWC
mgnify:CR=1 FL=1